MRRWLGESGGDHSLQSRGFCDRRSCREAVFPAPPPRDSNDGHRCYPMNANWRKSSLACFDALPGERIVAIDMHTAGEPLRIVLDAPIFPHGADVLARRRDASEGAWDRFRRVLMVEPRGHAALYCAIITAPVT